MTQVERHEGRAVVRPETDIVAATADGLRQVLKEVVASGVTELEIDLSGVGMVDSVGIGLFISAHNSLGKLGGKLKISNASKDICDLFKNMRLDQHFTVNGA
jgi:anti-anti-sigma factor